MTTFCLLCVNEHFEYVKPVVGKYKQSLKGNSDNIGFFLEIYFFAFIADI